MKNIRKILALLMCVSFVLAMGGMNIFADVTPDNDDIFLTG